jgi:hypothetical protein
MGAAMKPLDCGPSRLCLSDRPVASPCLMGNIAWPGVVARCAHCAG